MQVSAGRGREVTSNRSFDTDTLRHYAAIRAWEHNSRGAMSQNAGQLRR
jgi:hypothetical protein